MLLSAVSVLVVAQSSSEIPEGLMNNPVYTHREFDENVGFWLHNTSHVCTVLCFLVQCKKIVREPPSPPFNAHLNVTISSVKSSVDGFLTVCHTVFKVMVADACEAYSVLVNNLLLCEMRSWRGCCRFHFSWI